jgi:glutaredoxin-related protein
MSKHRVEIFTAGCPVCNPIVDMVRELVTEGDNEVTVYNLVQQCETEECLTKVQQYGIKRLPAIVINGELLGCCKNNGITRDDLLNAGIGKKNYLYNNTRIVQK